jgi:hypothetical protein
MARGVEISEDLKQVLIRMKALKLETKLIGHYTGVPIRTIQHIVHNFNTAPNHGSQPRPGRRGKLTNEDADVSDANR